MAYQIQDGYFHHALVEIGRAVLDHLHRNHFLRPEILALDDLTERTLAENVQNQIPVPKPSSQPLALHPFRK